MRIGIMGTLIDNANHGCVALLYSLVHIIEDIRKDSNEDYEYVVFDWKKKSEENAAYE